MGHKFLRHVTAVAFFLSAAIFAITVDTAPSYADDEGGQFDEPVFDIGKDPKPKTKKAKKPKKEKKKKKVKPGKHVWAGEYEQSKYREIRDEQTKLRDAVRRDDLESAIVDKSVKKPKDPNKVEAARKKRYKPLYDFIEKYKSLERRANTQEKKLELAKMWNQMRKYARARVHLKTAANARGLIKAFEVDEKRIRAVNAKANLEKVTEEVKERNNGKLPTFSGKIFQADNDRKRANQEFRKARADLPRFMQGAFPKVN